MGKRKKPELIDREIITSAQVDPARTAVGSSPAIGDLTNTGIVIPEYATPNQHERYLFLLCGLYVPGNTVAVLRYLRQLLYIGANVQSENEQNDEQWLIEIPVTDPLWSFPNGNVSWHLTKSTVFSPKNQTFPDVFAGGGSGYVTRGDVTGPGLIARRPALALGAYEPLNGGMPYGIGIGGLGTFRDMRFPWNDGHDHYLGLQVRGPCLVQFFASVYQTDPDGRPNKPVAIEQAGLRNEDVFMFNYPTARYTRVGGRMEVDLITEDEVKSYPISS